MTKEELKVKVAKQLSIINDANDEICSYGECKLNCVKLQ